MLLYENHDKRAHQISIHHVTDLRNMIESLHRQNSFDEIFYEKLLQYLPDISGDPPSQAKSIILVAYKDPPVRFSFAHMGKKIELLVPPTYLHARRKDQEVFKFLKELPKLNDAFLTRASLPRKLMAVCCGLAEYGKNNITYIKGFGSYHRMTAFYSDTACEEDSWREPVMMERCKTCLVCTQTCPTGAIKPDRFLLHVERCLTFYNEESSEIPFPAWMKREWQNCLVGCMHCQTICPENKDVRDWVERGEDFSEEETDWLLSGKPVDEISDSLKEKLTDCDLFDMLEVIPRNLGVFFE